MGKILFVLGGARSGKSSYAVDLAKSQNKKTAYIATCIPYDDEMNERVRLHKEERPSGWATFEEPSNLTHLFKDLDSKFEIVILDCITLFITNLMQNGLNESDIKDKINEMMTILKDVSYNSIIISNEVGLGIVPDTPLGREFRDIAGRVNQIIAKYADEVVFVAAGIPLKMKGI
jgi:adenosylcobinamide kinase / adenosylcobinamide-phosphate guanylyltransferase